MPKFAHDESKFDTRAETEKCELPDRMCPILEAANGLNFIETHFDGSPFPRGILFPNSTSE